jgi:hypothetical protein
LQEIGQPTLADVVAGFLARTPPAVPAGVAHQR